MILTAFGTAAAFMQGIMSLSFSWILVGMIEVYFIIVIYSIYDLVEFEGEQKESHQSASSNGYSQCCEPDFEKGKLGYQAPASDDQ